MMTGDVQGNRYVIHPARFALWLFIGTIILFFGGLTSAYIVSKGIEQDKGTWLQINLPQLLWGNTAVIVASSLSIQWALSRARKDDFRNLFTGLGITLALGILFLAGQMLAWNELEVRGVRFASSNAGDFLYMLTGAHGAHIIAGLVFLIVVTIRAARGKYNRNQLSGLENCVTFWHFLGLLWIYLFIFLLINHQ